VIYHNYTTIIRILICYMVLGHPEYYPRFGFFPSVNYNIFSEYDVPDDAFMILELSKGCLQGKQGKIKYHKAFSEA